MNKIIISAFTVLLGFSSLAAAEQPVDIAAIKQQILQSLDKEVAEMTRIRDRESGIIGQFRTCIQGIKNEADFKNCDSAKNEAYKKMKMELEKAYLENQKKAIANQEKQLNDAMKDKK